MRALVLAALLSAAGFVAPASAHIRHVHRWPVWRGFELRGPAPDLARTALRYVGDRKFTPYRGPWCRDAINVWLRQDGYRTDGSRLALEALYLGPHLRRPRPGALGVMRRRGGGHVVVVVRALGDLVEAVSPNWRGRVALVAYPLKRFLAFVRPVRG